MTRVPQRTCVGCRRRAPRGTMARVAAPPAGRLETGVGVPGRGAWVCSEACFDLAVRRGSLARALRRDCPADEIAAVRATLFG